LKVSDAEQVTCKDAWQPPNTKRFNQQSGNLALKQGFKKQKPRAEIRKWANKAE